MKVCTLVGLCYSTIPFKCCAGYPGIKCVISDVTHRVCSIEFAEGVLRLLQRHKDCVAILSGRDLTSLCVTSFSCHISSCIPESRLKNVFKRDLLLTNTWSKSRVFDLDQMRYMSWIQTTNIAVSGCVCQQQPTRPTRTSVWEICRFWTWIFS